MKKLLFVLLDKFADWEGAYLSGGLQFICKQEYAVRTASLTKDPVRSIGGFIVTPDYDVDDAPRDFDALVLIGGMSWRRESAKKVIPLVEFAVRNGIMVASICDAAGFLGTMGLLNHIKHSCNDLEDLKAWAGAAYTGEQLFSKEPVSCSGGIITARGTAPVAFAKEVMYALDVAPKEAIDGWLDMHKEC